MLSLMGQKKIATQKKFYTHQNVLQEQSLNKDIFRQTKSELSAHRTSLNSKGYTLCKRNINPDGRLEIKVEMKSKETDKYICRSTWTLTIYKQ